MGNRYYPVGDKELASVTTITGTADKSAALIPWAVNCAVDYCQEHTGSFVRQGPGSTFYIQPAIWDDARTKWREIRDEAGHIGTMVHDALEEYLHGIDNLILTIAGEVKHPDPVVRKCAEMALALRNAAVEKLMALGPYTVLATEAKVVNEDEWYAGRYDVKILIHDTGKVRRIDFKTGKSFYPEWALQLVAYDEADDERADELHSLRLDKKTLKAYWSKDYSEGRGAFLRAFLGLRDAFYILKAKKAAKEAFLNAR